MIVQRLVALLLALAMIAAPLGMPAMAEAAAPAAAHGAPGADGHCDEQPMPDSDQPSPDKDCCVAMCVAMMVPSGMAALPQVHESRERPASDPGRRGFLGEIATPPPKRA